MKQDSIGSLNELEENLSNPTSGVVETLGRLDSDVLILGVGGKMGPSLSRMVRRGMDQAGVNRPNVSTTPEVGLLRFSSSSFRLPIESCFIQHLSPKSTAVCA